MTEVDFDYKLFFELSPDLLCIAGFDGYFKRVNPAVSHVLGYSEEELYARPIDDFVWDEDKEVTSRSRKSVIESETLFHFENRYVTKSGEIVWLAWTSKRSIEEGLIFAIAKVITLKKRLEIERMALLEDLANVNSELKQFNLTSSHDLRSPLSNLFMVFDMLDVSHISDQDRLELNELLKLTGVNLRETLDSYVDVLSDRMGGTSEPEDVDLEECLNGVLPLIESIIRASKATIHTDFSEAKSVKFNRVFMDSVYLNLISNSLKYARPEIAPIITIRSEKRNGTSRVIFTDNGLGFDMEKNRNRIFGINQTFHNHKDSKGVGLYLVHSHVTSMGGEIGVESKVGEGTRFTMTFPDM